MSISFSAQEAARGSLSQPGIAASSEKFAGCAGTNKADSQHAEFRTWMEKYFQKGISEDRRREVTEYADEFEALIDKVAQADGEGRPLEFVRSLSSGEREVLRHMHGLAGEVNPATLSEEGALNLLRAPGSARDIDRDGFQMVGAAKTWTFPPPDAPDAVKQAWEDATRDLSGSEVMLLQGTFLPIAVEGHASASAYLGPDSDYEKLVRDALEGAEYNRRYDEPWQTETRNRQIELLKDLLGRLATQ